MSFYIVSFSYIGMIEVIFQIKKTILLFVAAALSRCLYLQGVPIPYMLGGIISAATTRIFIDKSITWKKSLREYALLAVGYGIGRNFTQETASAIISQGIGVLEACISGLGISILFSYIYRSS